MKLYNPLSKSKCEQEDPAEPNKAGQNRSRTHSQIHSWDRQLTSNVLSPKKWISLNSSSTNCKQYVLSQPCDSNKPHSCTKLLFALIQSCRESNNRKGSYAQPERYNEHTMIFRHCASAFSSSTVTLFRHTTNPENQIAFGGKYFKLVRITVAASSQGAVPWGRRRS